MPTLSNLPSETLLQVIELLKNPDDVLGLDREDGYHHYDHRSTLAKIRPVSLINKRINAVCNDIIFQTYYVSLNRPSEDDAPGSIAHAMTKRHSIRKLVLQHGERWAHHEAGALYPLEVLDRLLRLARAVSQQVTILAIRDKNGNVKAFNLAIWETFLAMPLRMVSICNITIPQNIPGAGTIRLDTLRMTVNDNTKSLLDHFQARSVDLTFIHSSTTEAAIDPYRPTNDLLESIKLSYSIPDKAPHLPPLDFTNVLHAKVHIKFYMTIKYKMSILDAWKRTFEMINKLVVDLDQFNVTRHDTRAIVTRPSFTAELSDWE